MSNVVYVAHGFSFEKRPVQLHNKVFTRANAWTSLGIASVVTYAVLLHLGRHLEIIPWLVICTIGTDAVDGMSAAKWNAHTRLGALLDPLRDRLLGAVLLINMWCVMARSGLTVFLLLACLLLLSEIIIAIGNLLWFQEVHCAGKVRFGIHGACGLQFVGQTYLSWWALHIDERYLLGGMTLASLALLGECCGVWTHRQTARVL